MTSLYPSQRQDLWLEVPLALLLVLLVTMLPLVYRLYTCPAHQRNSAPEPFRWNLKFQVCKPELRMAPLQQPLPPRALQL